MIERLLLSATFVAECAALAGNETHFQTFARVVQQLTPGASVMGYNELVTNETREAFELLHGNIVDVLANGSRAYAGDRPLYFPSVYVQPRSVPDIIDTYHLPGRAVQFDAVLSTLGVVTSPVKPLLLNVTVGVPVMGVLIAAPVFAHGAAPTRDNVIGIATLLLSASVLVNVPAVGSTLSYSLTDVSAGGNASQPFNVSADNCWDTDTCSTHTWTTVRMLLNSDAEWPARWGLFSAARGMTLVAVVIALCCNLALQTLSFAGRTWQYDAVATVSFMQSFRTSLPWIMLAIGILCILLVLLLMFLLIRMDQAEAIRAAAVAASQAHHWLLNYVVRRHCCFCVAVTALLHDIVVPQCHEVRNPLHGANECLSRLKELFGAVVLGKCRTNL